MNEYRITWAYMPTSQNTTNVSFIEATDIDDAEDKLIDKIERTNGRMLGVYTCDLVKKM